VVGVCINPWSIEDRKLWSKRAKEILGEHYSNLLLEDEIPSTAYDAIVDIVKTSIEFSEENRNKDALFILREVVDALKQGNFREEDGKVWICIDKDDLTYIDDFAKMDKKLKLLEHLKNFIDSFECR